MFSHQLLVMVLSLCGRESVEINLEIRDHCRNLEISYALSEVSEPRPLYKSAHTIGRCFCFDVIADKLRMYFNILGHVNPL